MNETEFLLTLKTLDFARGEQGLKVYLSQYLLNHIDALNNRYPVFAKAVGESNFRFFSQLYLKANPPAEPDIDRYGADFAEFIAGRRELEEYQILYWLAKLDEFWYGGHVGEKMECPKGTFQSWQIIRQQLHQPLPKLSTEKEVILVKEERNHRLMEL